MGIHWRLVPDVALLVQSVGGVGDAGRDENHGLEDCAGYWSKPLGADISRNFSASTKLAGLQTPTSEQDTPSRPLRVTIGRSLSPTATKHGLIWVHAAEGRALS